MTSDRFLAHVTFVKALKQGFGVQINVI